jgi:dehydrogenase/reductase SDR family member 7B
MRCEFVNYCFENHTGLFDINVHAPFNHLQAIVPHFIKHKGGKIVGISSLSGKLAKAFRSSYAGSKHAFVGILDSIRSELKPYNIKVCNILPGYIKTNLGINALVSKKGEKCGKND